MTSAYFLPYGYDSTDDSFLVLIGRKVLLQKKLGAVVLKDPTVFLDQNVTTASAGFAATFGPASDYWFAPNNAGQWGLFGGRQEAGETGDAAAFREFYEESDVDLRKVDVAQAYDLRDGVGVELRDRDEQPFHVYYAPLGGDRLARLRDSVRDNLAAARPVDLEYEAVESVAVDTAINQRIGARAVQVTADDGRIWLGPQTPQRIAMWVLKRSRLGSFNLSYGSFGRRLLDQAAMKSDWFSLALAYLKADKDGVFKARAG